MKRLLFLLITPLSIIGCTSQSDGPNDQAEIKEEKLPVYNIDPETFIPREFGIMDLVNDDLEIIRLETCLDCFIGHPLNMVIEDEFILVGSLTGSMKPGELLLFSKDGDFEHKFGKGGRGPGEHVGRVPKKVRYYEEDSTVMVYWEGGQSSIQLFDLGGDFMGQIDYPYSSLGTTVERLSDSSWFLTGHDDWGNIFGWPFSGDSIRFALFSENGEIIQKIPRTNFPALSKFQEEAHFPWSRPYSYNGIWKFNMRGNDTLFSIGSKDLDADAILASPTTELPPSVRVLRETNQFFMLDIVKMTMVNNERENERFLALVDKSTKKTYSVKLLDNAFFILDNFNRYDGDFMEVHFEWGVDRLAFAISANEWVERAKELDTSKLRPTIREKLKVLEGLRKDDNPIVFTFTLKDEIDFD